ncbi:hypothetical protein TKK_0000937 [Trichogramma kaykai]
MLRFSEIDEHVADETDADTCLPTFKTQDFIDDLKVINPEIEICSSRIAKIFSTLMAKVEIIANFTSETFQKILLEVLNEKEWDMIRYVMEKFFRSKSKILEPTASNVFENDCSVDERKKSTDNLIDEYDCSNSADVSIDLLNIIELLESKMCELKEHTLNREIFQPNLFFSRHMKYFMEYCLSNVKRSSEENRKEELDVQHVTDSINYYKHKIAELNRVLEAEKIIHSKEQLAITERLDIAEETWQNINKNFNDKLEGILQKSNDNIEQLLKDANEKINQHEMALKNLKTKFDNSKANNQKVENEIQKKKFKAESQLSSILQKFDTEIGEYQINYDIICAEFNDLFDKKTQLLDEMQEQLKIYTAIVEEREAKAYAIFKEKYDRFVFNRSAKVIQRWYRKAIREYMIRKSKKLRGHKRIFSHFSAICLKARELTLKSVSALMQFHHNRI